MANKKVTATELKRDTSKILNEVIYTSKPIDVYKYGEMVASITPVKGVIRYAETKKEKLLRLRDKYAGSMPNFPDVTKDRVNKDLDKLYE